MSNVETRPNLLEFAGKRVFANESGKTAHQAEKKLASNFAHRFGGGIIGRFGRALFKEWPRCGAGIPATIGRIEGDDLEVATNTPAGIEKDAAPTVVASGSEVTLRSGHALLMLNAGGEISICGPAHFKMLESSGAVTLALDYGRVHPNLDSRDTFTIYTPTVIATPIAIGGGGRDTTLGLEQGGEMCVLTKTGAMRVEPQFADQSLIVPQGGTVSLSGGQIDSLHGNPTDCSCDFPRPSVKRVLPPAPPAPPPVEISVLHHPIEPEPKKNVAPPPPSADEPVYTVLMPPLSFDAKSPEAPPEPDPETIVLVREVRMRSSVAFHGHVDPAPSKPTAATVVTVASPKPDDDRPLQSQAGLMVRMRTLFRRLTGHAPCAGAGCND